VIPYLLKEEFYSYRVERH